MSHATLMTYVDADGMPEGRVRFAASLADRFGATLIGLSGRAPIPGVVSFEGTEADIKEIEARLAHKGEWFRGIAGAKQRKLEWRAIVDFPTDAPAREARSADLLVIGWSRGAGDAYSLFDPGGAILKSGRPGAGRVSALHVVIGWNEDAGPFLRRGKTGHDLGSGSLMRRIRRRSASATWSAIWLGIRSRPGIKSYFAKEGGRGPADPAGAE